MGGKPSISGSGVRWHANCKLVTSQLQVHGPPGGCVCTQECSLCDHTERSCVFLQLNAKGSARCEAVLKPRKVRKKPMEQQPKASRWSSAVKRCTDHPRPGCRGISSFGGVRFAPSREEPELRAMSAAQQELRPPAGCGVASAASECEVRTEPRGV